MGVNAKMTEYEFIEEIDDNFLFDSDQEYEEAARVGAAISDNAALMVGYELAKGGSLATQETNLALLDILAERAADPRGARGDPGGEGAPGRSAGRQGRRRPAALRLQGAHERVERAGHRPLRRRQPGGGGGRRHGAVARGERRLRNAPRSSRYE